MLKMLCILRFVIMKSDFRNFSGHETTQEGFNQIIESMCAILEET